jgi:branched-chain amino acid transport system ATP-binding protein
LYVVDSSALLSVSNLSMRFGGLLAVDNVSFAVAKQGITALIGPNGAGKTTVFNCITGFYQPTSGTVQLHAPHKTFDLHNMRGDLIVRKAGVARTFQNIRLFPQMSVFENMLVAGSAAMMKCGFWRGLFNLKPYQKAKEQASEQAKHWLKRVHLWESANRPAGSLSYGQQRRLEIVRALMTKPRLLCLDEPAAGLNPKESGELNELLLGIRDEAGIALLLIEHDMRVVMNVAEHIIVLEYGRKIADGLPEEIRHHPEVIRAYLGDADVA